MYKLEKNHAFIDTISRVRLFKLFCIKKVMVKNYIYVCNK